jgi:CRISPR-associated protein Csh1
VLKAVYELGKLMSSETDPIQSFTTDIGSNYIHELAIVLEKKGDDINYVRCEKRSKSKRNYLFREKKGNVPVPMSLTVRDAGKGSEKIIDKFIKFGEANRSPLATKISKVLSDNKEEIIGFLDEIISTLSKKEGKFYTIVITEEGKEKYPGDFAEFREIFLKNIFKKVNEVEGTCFLCGKKGKVGFKTSEIFKFSSFDKPGFAYEMDDKKYYVNMPICLDCFSSLSMGKKVIDEDLSMNFYGSRVYIIPRFYNIDVEDMRFLMDVSKDIKRVKELKDVVVNKNNNYNSFEIYMSEYLSQGSYTTLNFVFYTVNNQEMKIHLSVLDVPPSRLRHISKVAEGVERELTLAFKTKEYQPSVMFYPIYEVFKNNRFRTFFDYVEAVFKDEKISLQPLKRSTLEYVASLKLNSNPYATRAKQLITAAFFVSKLQNSKEGGNLSMDGNLEERLEAFFNQYADFFRTNEEKFLFIMGQIHSRISRLQHEKEIASTVDLKLKAYNMRPRDFMNHFKELRWKVTQYSREMDPSTKDFILYLFKIADKYALRIGFNWKSSIEDSNYAFLIGELATGVFKKPFVSEQKDDARSFHKDN